MEETEGNTNEVYFLGHNEIDGLHRIHYMGVDNSQSLCGDHQCGVQIWTEIELDTNPDPAYRVEETNWTMSAIVINQWMPLSIVDYGPGRIPIWKEIRDETVAVSARVLNE